MYIVSRSQETVPSFFSMVYNIYKPHNVLKFVSFLGQIKKSTTTHQIQQVQQDTPRAIKIQWKERGPAGARRVASKEQGSCKEALLSSWSKRNYNKLKFDKDTIAH